MLLFVMVFVLLTVNLSKCSPLNFDEHGGRTFRSFTSKFFGTLAHKMGIIQFYESLFRGIRNTFLNPFLPADEEATGSNIFPINSKEAIKI